MGIDGIKQERRMGGCMEVLNYGMMEDSKDGRPE